MKQRKENVKMTLDMRTRPFFMSNSMSKILNNFILQIIEKKIIFKNC